MYVKHVPALALAAALTSVAICSAAVRSQTNNGADTPSANIQVRLKPGDTYILPIPTTRYEGTPIEIDVSDPSVARAAVRYGGSSWIMHQVVSFANGAASWIGQTSFGAVNAGYASAGQTTVLNTICIKTQGCGGEMLAVPVGSGGEGLQLSVPTTTPFGSQTFVISIRVGA